MNSYLQNSTHNSDAEYAFRQSTEDLTAMQPDYNALRAANETISLMHLIGDLQKTRGQLFRIADINDQGYGAEWVGKIISPYHAPHKNFRMFCEILFHLESWHQNVTYHLPFHALNPLVKFFYSEAQRLGLQMPPVEFEYILYGQGDQTTMMCARLNELVKSIRQIEQNSQVSEAVKKFIRASNDNYSSATRYIESLFAVHARLLVVRVDLSYLKYTNIQQQHYHPAVSIEQFLMHRRQLLESIQRNPIFGHLLGYVIKLEHGREKGFHCHCLFLFDGSKVREDISRATMIGDFWKNHITKGSGLHFNCNLEPKYYYNGLGMVNYDDVEKRFGLDLAIKYMTKPDGIARLSLGNARIFSRGEMPDVPEVPLGRPRMP